MGNLFKTRFVPNSDGSDSTTPTNNTNTVFVHTYIGDDFSSDGTREFPFKSIFKAIQKSGMNYIVFRGVINESVNTDKTIIGDDINQMIISADYNPRMGSVIRFTCDYINNAYGKTQNCIIKNTKLQQISIGYDYVFTNQILINAAATTQFQVKPFSLLNEAYIGVDVDREFLQQHFTLTPQRYNPFNGEFYKIPENSKCGIDYNPRTKKVFLRIGH